MVANTSFIAAFSSINRGVTFVRRRSSSNERKFVVLTRMRAHRDPVDGEQRVEVFPEASYGGGVLATVGVREPVRGAPHRI